MTHFVQTQVPEGEETELTSLHPAPFMTSAPTPKRPVGWTAAMTHFVQTQVPEGEETDSVIILVEAEYTSMDGKVGSDWIKSLMTSVSHSTVFAAFRLTPAHHRTRRNLKKCYGNLGIHFHSTLLHCVLETTFDVLT